MLELYRRWLGQSKLWMCDSFDPKLRRRFQRVYELIKSGGLYEICINSKFVCTINIPLVRGRTHDNDWQPSYGFVELMAEPLQRVQARHFWHLDIQKRKSREG